MLLSSSWQIAFFSTFWLLQPAVCLENDGRRRRETAVIVGVFDEQQTSVFYRQLFKFVVDRSNTNQRQSSTKTKQSDNHHNNDEPPSSDVVFEARSIVVKRHETQFHLWRRVCRELSTNNKNGRQELQQSAKGTIALFAPPNNVLISENIAALAESKQIPFITYTSHETLTPTTAVNYFPQSASISRLTSQLIVKYWQWQRYAILYQAPFDAARAALIAPLLHNVGGIGGGSASSDDDTLLPASAAYAAAVIIDDIDPMDIVRKVQQYSQRPKSDAVYRFVLSGDEAFLLEMLTTLRMYGMMTEDYHYHLLNWNLHRIDFASKFRMTLANITSVQLVDMGLQQQQQQSSSPSLRTLLNSFHNNNNARRDDHQVTENEPVEVAYMLDSLTHTMASYRNFTNAILHDAENDNNSGQELLKSVDCNNNADFWTYGNEFVQFIRQQQHAAGGFTGPILFNANTGARRDFNMRVTRLMPNGTFQVTHSFENGRLFSVPRHVRSNNSSFTTRTTYSARIRSAQPTMPTALAGGGTFAPIHRQRLVRVTSILDTPFLMLIKSADRLEGNERFEGYAVDFVDALSRIVGFNYTIEVVKDSAYGNLLPSGEWNGMVGELIRGEADIAVAPMSISFDREQAIDFSKPFMAIGVSILYRRPAKMPPNLFSFIEPFSPNVWLYLGVTCVAITILTYVMARFSPYEWYNPHRCDTESEIRTNNFNFSNTMWFAAGSLLQQGSDILPRAVSTRVLGGIWWIFTLIIVSSYTANLAAFLTVERVVLDIESAENLANQKVIKYGCVTGGTTCRFFEKSRVELYQRMWKAMAADQNNFVSSNGEGVQRVLQGGYAFFMESAGLEYRTQRLCDLVQIGGTLNSKGYGVGLAENSDLRDPISNAILKLQEENELHKLKDKWWKQKGGGVCESQQGSGGKVNPLGMPNLGGVFVVLVGGLLCGPFVAAVELIWKSRNYARQDGVSVWRELALYIHFAFKCHFRTDEGTMRGARKLAVARAAAATAARGAQEQGATEGKSLFMANRRQL